jgi:hypothetical protein
MRHGRHGRLFPLEMNQKSLFYLQMFLHEYKDKGLRDTDEKRRSYNHALDQIRKGINGVYAHQNMNGLRPPRTYNFRSK